MEWGFGIPPADGPPRVCCGLPEELVIAELGSRRWSVNPLDPSIRASSVLARFPAIPVHDMTASVEVGRAQTGKRKNGGVAILVVIFGPIASGKSSVAEALGRRLRHAGRDTAVLEVDDVVDTIGGFSDLKRERFNQSFTVHGHLVGAWLDNDVDVIAVGPFYEEHEVEGLIAASSKADKVHWTLLQVAFEVALSRVGGDPTRVLSKDPQVLRNAYNRFESLVPTLPPCDSTFDTGVTSVSHVVETLASVLGLPNAGTP
jgi:hypothetical protein